VIGDLSTPGIVIEEGAKLEGRIVIGEEETSTAQGKRTESATAPPREKAAASGQAPSSGATPSPS
jgi:cytoskeletal protein CcmA (bactofilin family)